MFTRHCENRTQDHPPHEHVVHWKKKDLPHLRHPELYPREWDATYRCPGTQIEAFLVEYLHEDCTPCEACADMAIERAKELEHASEVWSELGLNEEVLHMAEVTRV